MVPWFCSAVVRVSVTDTPVTKAAEEKLMLLDDRNEGMARLLPELKTLPLKPTEKKKTEKVDHQFGVAL